MPPKLPAHLPPPPTGAKSKSVRTGGKAPPRNLPKTIPHRAAAKSEESPKEREPRPEPAPASPTGGEAEPAGRREVPSKAPATGPQRTRSRPPLPPHASPPKKLPPGQGNKAKHPPPAPAPPRVRSQSPAAGSAADAEPKDASASATEPDQAAAARDGSSECSPPADDTPAQPAKPRSPPSPQQQRSGKSRPKLPSSLPPRGGRPSSVASNDRVRAARITPPRPARRVDAVGQASEADETAPAPAPPAPASENIAERERTPTNDVGSESEVQGSCDEAQSTRSVEAAPVDVAQPPESPEAGGSPPSHGSPGRNGPGSGSVAAPARRPQVPVPTRDHRDNLHGRRRDRADDDDDDGRGSRCSEEVAEGCAPRPAEPRHSRLPSTSAASPPQRRTATPEAQRRMRRGELDSSLHTTVASQPPTNTFVPAVHVDRRYVAASQLSTRTAQSEASGSRYTYEDDAHHHHSDAAAPPSTRSSRARAPDDTRLHAEDAGYGAPRSQRGPSQRSQHSSRSLVPEWNASTNTRSLSARSGPRSTAPSEFGSEAPQRPQPVELPPLFCISLVVLPPPPPSLVASSSQGKVRASWHSVARNFKVRVHGDLASELTVIQIKRAVASVTEFPLEKQRLLHNGVELAGLGPGEVIQDHFARLQEEGAPTDESTPGPHFFVMPRAESPHRASAGNPIAHLSAGHSADRNEPLAPAMLDIAEEGASPQASGSRAATPRRVPSAEARQSSLRTIQGPSPAAASYLVTPGSHTRPRLGGGGAGARADVRAEADGREEAAFIDSYASDAPLERRLLLDSPRAGNKQAVGRQEGGRHGSRQTRGSTSVAHPAPVSPVRADGSPRLRPGAAATRADSEASSVSFRSVTQSTAAGRGQSRASAYTRMSVEAPKHGASVHTDPLADAFVGAVERRMQRTSDALYDVKRKRREARDRGDDFTAALLADDAAALENDLERDNELLITLNAPPLSATSSRAPSYAVQPAAASQRPAEQRGDSRPRPPGASPAVFVSPMTEHDTNPGTAERGASPWTAEPVQTAAKHPHHDTQPHSLGATEPFADAPQRAPSRGPHDVPTNRSGGTASEPAAAAGANGPASSRNALPPRRRPPSASATA